MRNDIKNNKESIQVKVAAPAGDLSSELAHADETIKGLRLEIMASLTKYRMWRAHMRCGRAIDSGLELFNMPMVKKIRGLWATYRFAQMVRADIRHMMAQEAETRQRLQDLQNVATYGFKPELVTYEELEARFGAAAAQDLYDDMLAQTARDAARRKLVS